MISFSPLTPSPVLPRGRPPFPLELGSLRIPSLNLVARPPDARTRGQEAEDAFWRSEQRRRAIVALWTSRPSPEELAKDAALAQDLDRALASAESADADRAEREGAAAADSELEGAEYWTEVEVAAAERRRSHGGRGGRVTGRASEPRSQRVSAESGPGRSESSGKQPAAPSASTQPD